MICLIYSWKAKIYQYIQDGAYEKSNHYLHVLKKLKSTDFQSAHIYKG